MIEFLQNYGLWIALAGVFVAMHWFGTGCCGDRHRQGQRSRQRRIRLGGSVLARSAYGGQGQGAEGVPDQAPKGEKTSQRASKSGGSYH